MCKAALNTLSSVRHLWKRLVSLLVQLWSKQAQMSHLSVWRKAGAIGRFPIWLTLLASCLYLFCEVSGTSLLCSFHYPAVYWVITK